MKSEYIRGLSLISILLFQASGALAQPSEEEELALAYGDNATVSIATGSPQPLRRAPAVASLITAEDIAAMGATDLDQVLETVPGLHVSVTNDYYSPQYIFRGISSTVANPQVLMLQNGIPVTIMYAGDRGRYWGGLPLENVARIEIIRGPGSALYGADAYAGVINIITKTAADTRGTVFGVRGGSFNTWNTWLQHGGKLGAVDVAAYFRVGSTDGQRSIVTADNATRLDNLFGTRSSLAPGPVNLGHDDIDGSLDFAYENWRLRAGYKLRDKLGTGAGVASALDPLGKNRSERITSDLSWSDPRFSQNWGLGFTAAYLHYSETLDANYQLLPPGSRFPSGAFPVGMIGDPSRFERQFRLSSFATYSGFAGHSLRFGLGHDDLNLYKTQTFKNYLLNPAGVPVPSPASGEVIDYNGIQPHILPHRRKLNYLYAQDEWHFAQDWTLTAGVRYDDYSDFGGTTNPRLALVWDANLDLTAKLLYGRAFRAPSFNDQYGTNPVGSGNPDIRPESISTLEAAFAWQARRDTRVNLSFFRYQMRDIIRATANPAPAPGTTFANAGAQHGNGMEVEVVWDAQRNLRLTGNYSYQKSIDETTHTDAGYAPHHHIYARADWQFTGGWLASGQVNWVADRKRAFGDARPDIADYTTVDLTVRSTRRKGAWDFAASVRNLFDATVLEPSLAPGTNLPNDLPMAPRSFWLQATYAM